MSYHHPQPEKIELTADEFKKLEAEIQGSNLNTKTKEMVIKSFHFMIWLQGSLEHAKLSIKKLQKLFGVIPHIRKKHRKNKGDEDNKSLTDEGEKDDEGGTGTASNDIAVNADAASNSVVISKKRSGRIPRSKYKNVKEISISHTDLKPGDLCPTLCCSSSDLI